LPRAGKTSFTQTDTDTTNPNEPAHYRTVTTTTTDAFRFTIQFARRIGPFTGRFGIKESTGGVGVDTLLGGDRFEVVQDLFGFGEEIKPRYRLFLGYEFIHRLWLLGGADHIFLPNRRDYFIGLQAALHGRRPQDHPALHGPRGRRRQVTTCSRWR